MTRKRLHRVVLVTGLGMTRSVFVKGTDRKDAERRALKQNPSAIRIDRSPNRRNI